MGTSRGRSAPSFFISYSTDDRKLARKLHDDLRDHGAKVYQFEESFEESAKPGSDAWDQVLSSIEESDWQRRQSRGPFSRRSVTLTRGILRRAQGERIAERYVLPFVIPAIAEMHVA